MPAIDWVWWFEVVAVAPRTAASDRLADVLDSLFRRRQLVLVTPPGTGGSSMEARLANVLGRSFSSVPLPPSAAGGDAG